MNSPSFGKSLVVRLVAIPIVVFLIGAAVPGLVAYRLLIASAEKHSHERAELVWRAVTYAKMGAPPLEALVPADPAAEAAAIMMNGNAFQYRELLRNDNGVHKPDNYEEQLMTSFESDAKLDRISGEVSHDGNRCYVIASPLVSAASGASADPQHPEIRVISNGSGAHRVAGLRVLYIPIGPAIDEAMHNFWTIFEIVALLSLFGAALLIWRTIAVVARPAREMLRVSQAIRRGDWAAKYATSAGDEMGVLATTFQECTRWLREQVAREEKLRAMFQQFVPAAVAARALGKQSDQVLAGARQPVTVMMVNIRNFKLLMEHLPPEQTVTVLNEFFTEVNRVVVANRGLVSKYLGDSVVALFGMPVANETHALDAVKAAVAIPRALQDMYVRLEENHGWELGVGIGISSGEPIVGHFGAGDHMEYTLLGDVVVEAHRMEKMTKSVPEEDSIVISEVTYRMVMSDVHVYDLGEKKDDAGTAHPYVVQGLRSEARSVIAA